MATATHPDAATFQFRVSSWNVLADCYSFSHPLPASFVNNFSERLRVIREKLLPSSNSAAAGSKPDILALQEVDHYEEFRNTLLEQGYEIFYTGRNGLSRFDSPRAASSDASVNSSTSFSQEVIQRYLDQNAPKQWSVQSSSKRAKTDGILLAWRHDRFRLCGLPVSVDFDDLAYGNRFLTNLEAVNAKPASIGDPNAAIQLNYISKQLQHESRYLRHNVGQFVFLQPLPSSSSASDNAKPTDRYTTPILVANTHLYWNPLHEEVKLKQVQYFLARLEIECEKRLDRRYSNYAAVEVSQSSSSSPASSSLSPEDDLVSQLQEKLQALQVSSATACTTATKAFPFVFCGDFNSSPLSKLYNYITRGVFERKVEEATTIVGSNEAEAIASSSTEVDRNKLGYSTAAPHPSAPRFICDSDLVKVAKWLRSIGVDCVHYNDAEKKARGGPTAIFDRAVKENRILLTKSIRLIERRGCPPWFLLKNENLETSFAALIQHFGLSFSEELFYSRCIFCNSGFDSYPAQYFLGGTDPATGITYEPHDPFYDIPRGFINMGYKDEEGNVLTFTRCRNEAQPFVKCGKLFWWGKRSGEAVQTFAAKFDAILSKQQGEDAQPATPSTTSTNVSSSESSSSNSSANGDENSKSRKKSDEIPQQKVSALREAEIRLAVSISNRELLSSNADISFHTQPIQFASAYTLGEEKCEPPFTNITTTFNDTLDYIFFHPSSVSSASNRFSLQVDGLKNVFEDSNLDLVALEKSEGFSRIAPAKPAKSPEPAGEDNGDGEATGNASVSAVAATPALPPKTLFLPNAVWPSDHLLLQAQFSLTYQPSQ